MLTDGRKVIDSFLISEPHELELLLVKLHAGAGWVDEFVAIEGAYTFRGEHKGLWLFDAVQSDPRLAPFRDRITVLPILENLFRGDPGEGQYFNVEFASREKSQNYLLSKYTDRDIVTCTDVDELLDFSDDDRAGRLDVRLRHTAAANRICWFQVLKFWYDFDNVSQEVKFIPAGPLGVAKQNWRMRQDDSRADVHREPPYLAFEYSFCFPREAIWRKLNTFSHDGYTPADLDRALTGNHWVKCAAKGEQAGDRGRADYFWNIRLDQTSSTSYVRERLAELKTHNVARG